MIQDLYDEPISFTCTLVEAELPQVERALNDLIEKASFVPETEYLKEDVFASPKFSLNPGK